LVILPELKQSSQKWVLNLIRQFKEISAAEISRQTGFRRSSVTYLLRELDKKGLTRTLGTGESTSQGGKPPTLLSLKEDYKHILGLEILPHGIRMSLSDFSLKILDQSVFPITNDMAADGYFSHLKDEVILPYLEKHNCPLEKLCGVGIGAPGIVSLDSGKILFSHTLKARDLPLKDRMEELLGVPVRVANDANAGALGSKWFENNGEAESNLVFLAIHESYTGMGMGLILNNRLFTGFSGSAGEIVPYMPELRNLITHRSIRQLSPNLLADENPADITIENICRKADSGCSVSMRILTIISSIISREVFRLVGCINPEQVIISGDLSLGDRMIIDLIREEVDAKCGEQFSQEIIKPKIQFSSLGIHSVSLGALGLIAEEIFSQPDVTPQGAN